MFYRHIHSFRAIAITGVVTQHCMNSITWSDDSLSHSLLAAGIFQASVWFTFISGFLFQHLSPRFTPSRYFEAKFKNVIVPYLIMSIPALLISAFVIHQDSVPPSFYDLPAWERVGIFVITGKHLAPFWYIPVIAMFYLAGPLFIRLDRAKWPYLLLIPLVAISFALGRDGFQGLMGGGTLWAPPSKALYLLAPYMLGMLCSRYHERIANMTWEECNFLGAIALVAFALNVHYFQGENEAAQFVLKIVTCPLLVWVTYRLSEPVTNKIGVVATYSFGIFFLHGYILAGLNMIAPDTALGLVFNYGGVAAWLVLTATLIMACYLILSSFKKYVFGSSSRLVMGV